MPAPMRTGVCAMTTTFASCNDCCNMAFHNTPDLWVTAYEVFRHNQCDAMFDAANPAAFNMCMESARDAAADAAQMACDADANCKGSLGCFLTEALCGSLP
jgi:hypothetical protein